MIYCGNIPNGRDITNTYTRQMLSIVASGSDATVVNGFFHSALEVVRRVVLAALPSPVQSQLLPCAAGCQRVVLDALLSPVQSRLPTCAAGWQRVVLDAALSHVQSRLLTCAAGVVDAPVSDRSSYSSCNPVLGWGLRNCRLSESCLRRCSLSCAVPGWLAPARQLDKCSALWRAGAMQLL